MKVRIKATGEVRGVTGVQVFPKWFAVGAFFHEHEVEFLPEEETVELLHRTGCMCAHCSGLLHKEQKEGVALGTSDWKKMDNVFSDTHQNTHTRDYRPEPLHQGQTIEEMKLRIAFNDGKIEGLNEGLASLNKMSEVFDRFNREVRNKEI